MRASSYTTETMKLNYVIVLKEWNTRKQVAETTATVGSPLTLLFCWGAHSLNAHEFETPNTPSETRLGQGTD